MARPLAFLLGSCGLRRLKAKSKSVEGGASICSTKLLAAGACAAGWMGTIGAAVAAGVGSSLGAGATAFLRPCSAAGVGSSLGADCWAGCAAGSAAGVCAGAGAGGAGGTNVGGTIVRNSKAMCGAGCCHGKCHQTALNKKPRCTSSAKPSATQNTGCRTNTPNAERCGGGRAGWALAGEIVTAAILGEPPCGWRKNGHTSRL